MDPDSTRDEAEALYAPRERPTLRVDASGLSRLPSTPSVGATSSPSVPVALPYASTSARPLSPSNPEFSSKEPASGPQRREASASTVSRHKESREKRKRSRVTPEQLTHLEKYFATDRSPTASRRREISDLLGMQERQTQIWFQNRRAKAKILNNKRQRSGDWLDSGSADMLSPLSPGFETNLASLIHEDEPVTYLPCSDLTIGSWRRIATAAGKNDLVAYICTGKRCLTWFIHSGGYGYKMEIPFDSVIHTNFIDVPPGQGLVNFTLSHPPTFFLEEALSPVPGQLATAGPKIWKKCADWTEGMQASNVLRHDLVGSAQYLLHCIQLLRENQSSPVLPYMSPVSGYPSSSSGVGIGSSSLRLPQLPLDTRRPDIYGIRGIGASSSHSNSLLESGRKRAFSTPAPFNPVGVGPPMHTTAGQPLPVLSEEGGGDVGGAREGSEPIGYVSSGGGYATGSTSQQQQPSRHMINTPHILDYMIPTISPSTSHHQQQQSSPQHHFADYSTVPISHRSMDSHAPRSYPVPTTTPTSTSDYYYDLGPSLDPARTTTSTDIHTHGLHRRSMPDITTAQTYTHHAQHQYATVDSTSSSTSPSMLTTGYQSGNLGIQQQHHHQQASLASHSNPSQHPHLQHHQHQHQHHPHQHVDDPSSSLTTTGMDPSSTSTTNVQYSPPETHQ